jgi:hypothetical protein
VSRRRIAIAEETGTTRSFAWVVDWPGWCRAARDRLALPAALAAVAPRYALVVARAGLDLGSSADDLAADDFAADDFELIETVPGSASTDFGVPGAIAEDDRRPLDRVAAERLANLVAAAWATFDDVVAGAPAELRKGPRGGGRDRDTVVAHCVTSDSAYATQIGLRIKEPAATDRPAVAAEREAILDVLRRPSDGSPLAGRRWPARYAARRIAWHALDHAWEIQDRS